MKKITNNEKVKDFKHGEVKKRKPIMIIHGVVNEMKDDEFIDVFIQQNLENRIEEVQREVNARVRTGPRKQNMSQSDSSIPRAEKTPAENND